MAEISKEQVKHVANLARLEFDDEAVEQMANELSAIIEYAEQLNELDTENIKPTTHVLDLKNVMRKDEPRKWVTQEDVLQNAPDQKDGQIRVPSILE